MKTYKRLFEKIISFENIFLATKKAQKGKRMKLSTARFNFESEKEILNLQAELKSQTYKPGAYRHFYVNDPKRRMISAAPYRDRVVHHAFCNIVEPLFDKTFIYDSYACRIEKGTHRALDRAQEFLRMNKYVLQCDIRKYFPSIDHQVLLSIIAKKIKDEKVLWLAELIIKSVASDEWRVESGLPIGNLTSQFFANLYLNELDYFVKFDLREKYYLRYMDDFLIFGNEKERLHRLKDEMGDFLEKNLCLNLHPKKSVVLLAKLGVNFCGFRIFKYYRRLRKGNIKLFVRRMKKQREQFRKGQIEIRDVSNSLQCWIAHASYGNTYNLRRRLFRGLVFSRTSL